MKINTPSRIMIVAALCAASLVGLVITEGAARRSGLEALLPMEAIDPRALLMGHYVQINLTERLDETAQCPRGGLDSKWLAFRREGGVYRLAGGGQSRDEAVQFGPTPVRGSFSCSPPTAPAEGVIGAPGFVQIDLGIDRFYINQAEATRIEQVLSDQRPGEEARAFAIVSMGRDGRARLKGLMVDGERFDLDWL